MAQTKLARQALRAALTLRRRLSIQRTSPICVYKVAEDLGVEVKFCGGSSFGGMYARGSRTILVPAERPPGRQVFTCAHELAHWHFNHGTRLEDINEMGRLFQGEDEERLANTFAGYLLMPPWAVEEAFTRRGWDPSTCTPLQLSICAAQLNVGYLTLVQHLAWSLESISQERRKSLSTTTPKQLRKQVLGADAAELTDHLVLADPHWNAVAIDLRVGDTAVLPEGAQVEGKSVRHSGTNGTGEVVMGTQPGISRAATKDGTWAAFIRVRRKEFVGRSIYRHMEDPDVNFEA